MMRRVAGPTIAVFLAVTALAGGLGAQDDEQSEREAMYRRYLEFPSYVESGSVEPHWMADGSSFWYAEQASANTVIYMVHPAGNTRAPLFDSARLHRALVEVLGYDPPGQGLPYADFTFLDGEEAVRFAVEDREFNLELATYAITAAASVTEDERERLAPRVGKVYGRDVVMETLSPDGRWFAGIQDYDVWLRSTNDGRSVQLTEDGFRDYAWGDFDRETQVEWSPDSFKLATTRVDMRLVPKIPLVHYLGPTEEVEWVPYWGKARAPIEQNELFILDILSKQRIRVEVGEQVNQRIFMLGWQHDASEFFFLRADRYFRTLALMAADPATGSTRMVLSEINEAPVVDLYREQPFALLQDGRFVWLSARDGWRHLYLYEADGTPIRRLTEGEFPVIQVVDVDERAGWVYFTAQSDPGRPYDVHLCRVTLDGLRFERLTQAPGQHTIQLAPSKQFFLDTHSSVDRPPVVELRRADGSLLQTLSTADVEGLEQLRWKPPEEFVVKAADGITDIYGVLYEPYDFDPERNYPVIEYIYGGGSVVPRTFSSEFGMGVEAQAMAQLGFIVFIVDGRGPWIGGARGREFERVAYGSWGRHEIPDHTAAVRGLAATRPYMDLGRVGLIGMSMGGYYAIRGLLQAPDVYHVGVAVAPVTDLYDHYNYRWLGPVDGNGEAYEYASNVRLAGNLDGKLLLIHGTNDMAVPISHTMKMAEALIRAGKDFDLIVLPEWGHWGNETIEKYWAESVRRYVQEHLNAR